jgi:eukaryotic-like serine/threonine-protein kinase
VPKGGLYKAMTGFDRAASLDPEFASAYLQRALTEHLFAAPSTDASRRALAGATQRRKVLDPREQALLDATTPGFGDPPDYADEAKRLEAFVRDSPGDTQGWALMAMTYSKLRRYEDALLAFARETASDPTDTLGDEVSAGILAYRDDRVGARRLLTECIERSSLKSSCADELLREFAAAGECHQMDRLARQRTAFDPTGADAYGFRADAAVGLMQPVEAIEALLHDKWSLLASSPKSVAVRAEDELNFAVLRGDFSAALKDLDGIAETEVASDWSAVGHTLVRINVLLEMGDMQTAAKINTSLLRGAAARPKPESVFSDQTLAVAHAAYELKAIGYPEYRRQRDDWLAQWRVTSSPEQWNEDKTFIWIAAYTGSSDVQMREEAEDALRALDEFGPLRAVGHRTYAYYDSAPAHVFQVLGRLDEAAARYESTARLCDLAVGMDSVRAMEGAGEVHEARGDLDAACTWYGRALDRWGSAKPRSVKADLARKAVARLRCSMRTATP